MLVLALVGVLAGLVAGNVGAFITGARHEPPERVLKKAILDAIYETSETKYPTFLSYNQEEASFEVSDTSGNQISSHSIYKGDLGEDYELPEILFEAIAPMSSPDGEPAIYDDDELSLSKIAFHYGSSVPFSVKISFRRETSVLQFDPFSGFLLKNRNE